MVQIQKQMSIEIYEGFIASFTNKIELERLKKLKLRHFIHRNLGLFATVLLKLHRQSNLNYRYYPDSNIVLANRGTG